MRVPVISRRFWQGSSSSGGRAYAETYRRLDSRDAVSVHAEDLVGDWSVVRLLRSDFENMLTAYQDLSREGSR